MQITRLSRYLLVRHLPYIPSNLLKVLLVFCPRYFLLFLTSRASIYDPTLHQEF